MVSQTQKWADEDPIGSAWLAREFGVEPIQPLRIVSAIGPSRAVEVRGNFWAKRYQEPYRPGPNLAEHLEFMLKHEAIHLELLARLFAKAGQSELAAWVQAKPTSRYARQAGFLYEWLTGRTLDYMGTVKGVYVSALPEDNCFTASEAPLNSRWRIRNNLPGTPSFCPTVHLFESVRLAQSYDLPKAFEAFEQDFGSDLVSRSAVWMTLKESRSSFAIEGEARHLSRIQRFAAVLENETGAHSDPLSEATLLHLQKSILGEQAAVHGIRQSPIFIGESRTETVHYIAPNGDRVAEMLDGLAAVERRTRGQNPLARACALSFGFVYIHPMTDGNGRISRFLVNDTLRRDGAVPDPYILPISAVIAHSSRDYDRILELLSKPLMRRAAGHYRFGTTRRYPDRLTSDFYFDGYEDCDPAWRYPDLTDHVVYLSTVLKKTIDREMRQEAAEMRSYRAALQNLKSILERPDPELERIVRSIHDNRYEVSNKLKNEFPFLESAPLAVQIAQVVRAAFE